MCDTCDDATGTPCFTHADCAPGHTCGGLRCLADSAAAGTPCTMEGTGTDPTCGLGPSGSCVSDACVSGPHPGTVCSTDQECGGTCSRIGEPTKPSSCNNTTCAANTPPDTDSIDEGICTAPNDQACAIETFRSCSSNADCPAPSDMCTIRKRQCFTANGSIGDSVSAGGVASTTSPTLAGLFCIGPSGSSAINFLYGLPGLGRVTIPGTVVTN